MRTPNPLGVALDGIALFAAAVAHVDVAQRVRLGTLVTSVKPRSYVML